MAGKGKIRPSGGLVLYRILMVMVLGLGLSLVGGTFYVLASRQEGLSLKRHQKNNTLPVKNRFSEPTEGQSFTSLGQIRVITASPNPATVIISITFPYDPEDKVFAEELASKIKDCRAVTSEYLGTFSVKELRALGEGEIKTELLRRYNLLLRLGHIEALYFSDFSIIE